MSQLIVQDEGVMTFAQIAEALGMSIEGVRQAYMRAIRKLRANPEAFVHFRALVDERNKIREGRASL